MLTLFFIKDFIFYKTNLALTLLQSHLSHRYCKISMLIRKLVWILTNLINSKPPGKKPPRKLLPAKLPPGNMSPEKFFLGKLRPGKMSPMKLPPSLENFSPRNCYTRFLLLLILSYSCSFSNFL